MNDSNGAIVGTLMVLGAACFVSHTIYRIIRNRYLLSWKKAKTFSFDRACGAAGLGDAEAQGTIGSMLLKEWRNREKNPKTVEALNIVESMLLKAANKNFIPAHETLADYYTDKVVGKVDYEKAWYHAAICYLKSNDKDAEDKLETLQAVEILAHREKDEFSAPVKAVIEYVNKTTSNADERTKCLEMLKQHIEKIIKEHENEQALRQTMDRYMSQVFAGIEVISGKRELSNNVDATPDVKLTDLAKKGDPHAQSSLGKFYGSHQDFENLLFGITEPQSKGTLKQLQKFITITSLRTTNTRQ